MSSAGSDIAATSAEATAPTGGSAFRRVVLKLSGEALLGERSYGIDAERVGAIARQIREAVELGVEVAIVVGAGNIFRGVAGASRGMDRATADYMGMIATVLNALSIQDALEKLDVTTRVQSAIAIPGGRRAVHPATRDAASREAARRDLRRRDRQPVLHDRHHGRARGRSRSAPSAS